LESAPLFRPGQALKSIDRRLETIDLATVFERKPLALKLSDHPVLKAI